MNVKADSLGQMRKKANGANRSEMLLDRFRTPLLHFEFQEKGIEPILNSNTLTRSNDVTTSVFKSDLPA